MLCVVVACSRCELIRQRLRHIPASPVHWGRFLAGVVAARVGGDAVGQRSRHGPTGRHSRGRFAGRPHAVGAVDDRGRRGADRRRADQPDAAARVPAPRFGLVTWSTLLVEMVLQGRCVAPGNRRLPGRAARLPQRPTSGSRPPGRRGAPMNWTQLLTGPGRNADRQHLRRVAGATVVLAGGASPRAHQAGVGGGATGARQARQRRERERTVVPQYRRTPEMVRATLPGSASG